jgi:hypothetical protein
MLFTSWASILDTSAGSNLGTSDNYYFHLQNTLQHFVLSSSTKSISEGSIYVIQGDQNVSVRLMITVQKTRKNILKSFDHLPW